MAGKKIAARLDHLDAVHKFQRQEVDDLPLATCAECNDEMVKAVNGHSGVEMVRTPEVRSGSENLLRGRRTRGPALNRTGRTQDCFNTCSKNRERGVLT